MPFLKTLCNFPLKVCFYPAKRDDYFLPGTSPGKKLVKVKCLNI
jgi:hypothetical protein